jgi:hypothetical protein
LSVVQGIFDLPSAPAGSWLVIVGSALGGFVVGMVVMALGMGLRRRATPQPSLQEPQTDLYAPLMARQAQFA